MNAETYPQQENDRTDGAFRSPSHDSTEGSTTAGAKARGEADFRTEEQQATPSGLPQAIHQKTRELIRKWSSKIARRNMVLLAAQGNIAKTLEDIPEQMHKVARQTRLVIEFVDDFRSGAYRQMPWWAVAVAASAMLYTVNPADVVPNAIPLVGMLDDLAVVAVAVRILQKELKRYCEFKGYRVEEYF